MKKRWWTSFTDDSYSQTHTEFIENSFFYFIFHLANCLLEMRHGAHIINTENFEARVVVTLANNMWWCFIFLFNFCFIWSWIIYFCRSQFQTHKKNFFHSSNDCFALFLFFSPHFWASHFKRKKYLWQLNRLLCNTLRNNRINKQSWCVSFPGAFACDLTKLTLLTYTFAFNSQTRNLNNFSFLSSQPEFIFFRKKREKLSSLA